MHHADDVVRVVFVDRQARMFRGLHGLRQLRHRAVPVYEVHERLRRHDIRRRYVVEAEDGLDEAVFFMLDRALLFRHACKERDLFFRGRLRHRAQERPGDLLDKPGDRREDAGERKYRRSGGERDMLGVPLAQPFRGDLAEDHHQEGKHGRESSYPLLTEHAVGDDTGHDAAEDGDEVRERDERGDGTLHRLFKRQEYLAQAVLVRQELGAMKRHRVDGRLGRRNKGVEKQEEKYEQDEGTHSPLLYRKTAPISKGAPMYIGAPFVSALTEARRLRPLPPISA